MAGIDDYDWSVFGGNPVPGDPDGVRALAAGFSDIADDARQQSSTLRNVGADVASVWTGPAADKFHPHITTLIGQLDTLSTSHADAADALGSYWPALRSAQDLALTARARAVAAQQAMAGASTALSAAHSAAASAGTSYDSAASTVVGATTPSPAQLSAASSAKTAYQSAQAGVTTAQGDLSAAQGAMTAAVAMKDAAVAQALAASTRAGAGLRAASAAGIHNPHHSWLSSALGDIGSVAKDAVHEVGQFGDGLYHGVAGPLTMLAKLADPLTAPAELEALAKGIAYGVAHPLQFGEAVLDWKDLSSGNVARWLGNLTPAVAAALLTGGAGDVADGLSGVTALQRAGVTADDVAALTAGGDESAAARILMRGEDPVPGTIYGGEPPQLGRDLTPPGTQEEIFAKEQGNFTGPVAMDPDPPAQWMANVHNPDATFYGDAPLDATRSLLWEVPPSQLLGYGSEAEARESLGLLPEWDGGGSRSEVTVLQAPEGAGVTYTGLAAHQGTEEAGTLLEGGGNQVLLTTNRSDWAVWTGPAPWVRVTDTGLAVTGAIKVAAAGVGARAASATSP